MYTPIIFLNSSISFVNTTSHYLDIYEKSSNSSRASRMAELASRIDIFR